MAVGADHCHSGPPDAVQYISEAALPSAPLEICTGIFETEQNLIVDGVLLITVVLGG